MDSTLIWIIASALAAIVIGVIVVKRKMPPGPPIPAALRKGEPLPHFSAQDEQGNEVHSSSLRGKPTVLLFVRGNWCPFCNRQVEQLTGHYKDIVALGAQLIFVTPKPVDTTRRVAKFFEVEFDFWLDDSLTASQSLGLVQPNGVPDDYKREYDNDTVWPTAVIVDEEGIIHYSKLSRFLYDRPDPELLLAELRNLQ